jgi:hypothetical protein
MRAPTPMPAPNSYVPKKAARGPYRRSQQRCVAVDQRSRIDLRRQLGRRLPKMQFTTPLPIPSSRNERRDLHARPRKTLRRRRLSQVPAAKNVGQPLDGASRPEMEFCTKKCMFRPPNANSTRDRDGRNEEGRRSRGSGLKPSGAPVPPHSTTSKMTRRAVSPEGQACGLSRET